MPMRSSGARQDRGAVSPQVILYIVIAILLVALIWCLSCYKGGGGKGRGGPGIKAKAAPYSSLPSGCPPNAAPSDTTELSACLQGLQFDTVPAVGDEQRLMIRDTLPGPACHGDSTHSCRYGPLAKIEPVIGAQEYTDTALEEGRIIARMFIRPLETDSYPKLGLLHHDTTYWYVNTTLDSSYFISKPPSGTHLPTTVRELEVEAHPGEFDQAVARWLWVETDEKGQGTCGQACCK